jgi:proteasome beta subunit
MQPLEMVNRIIEKHLKHRETRLFTENNLKTAKAHGTTILALKYNKGVIIAADRRCVAGETIFSDHETKIEEIGLLSCLAGAGWVCDCQWLVDILREEIIPGIERFWDMNIFVDGQEKLLKRIMRNIFLLTWPILAGWDPFTQTGRISLYEPGGAKFEFDDYVACGSGETGAKGILEKEWSKDCSEAKGIRIAIEALLAASKIDRNTSDSSIHAPIVKVISSEKIIDVPTEESYKIAWGIRMEEETRKGIKDGIGTYIVKTMLMENVENLGDKEKEKEKEDKTGGTKKDDN